MKKLALFLVLTASLLLPSFPALAIEEKPLDLQHIFNQSAIIPYNYQNNIFYNGSLVSNIEGNYKIMSQNGRVLLPMRFLTNNILGLNVNWNANKPQQAVISGNNISIKLNAGSKIVEINGQKKSLDTAPQYLGQRLVLPLRAVAEIFNKEVNWYNELIIISDSPFNLQAASNKEISYQAKAVLQRTIPVNNYYKDFLSVYNGGIYYDKYTDTQDRMELFFLKDGKNVKIDLPGKPHLYQDQQRFVINNKLYYLTVIDGLTWLYSYDFADDKTQAVVDLSGKWNIADGYLSSIKIYEGKIYLVAHYGDLIMGGESIFRVENGGLRELAQCKNMIDFFVVNNQLYYTDFESRDQNTNFFVVDMSSGAAKSLGQKGNIYDINYRHDESQNTWESRSSMKFYQDNLYIMNYKGQANDLGMPINSLVDKGYIVDKISLNDDTVSVLPMKVESFDIVDGLIYYIDANNGFLKSADLDGQQQKTIVQQRVEQLLFTPEYIYYTIKGKANSLEPGIYRNH
ncbi:MAG: stalk domain-containing protein, partial [Clostridiales bacterium]